MASVNMLRLALLFMCVAAAMSCSCLKPKCPLNFLEQFCIAKFVTRFKVESSKEVLAEKGYVKDYIFYGKHVEVFKGAPNDTFISRGHSMCEHTLHVGDEYLIMGWGSRLYLCGGDVVRQWSNIDDATKRHLDTYKYYLSGRKYHDAFCVPRNMTITGPEN